MHLQLRAQAALTQNKQHSGSHKSKEKSQSDGSLAPLRDVQGQLQIGGMMTQGLYPAYTQIHHSVLWGGGGEGLRGGGVIQARFPRPPPAQGVVCVTGASDRPTGGGVGWVWGSPTYIPQSDRHDTLIILRYISCGKKFSKIFFVGGCFAARFLSQDWSSDCHFIKALSREPLSLPPLPPPNPTPGVWGFERTPPPPKKTFSCLLCRAPFVPPVSLYMRAQHCTSDCGKCVQCPTWTRSLVRGMCLCVMVGGHVTLLFLTM